LTQAEFAAAFEFSLRTLREWERGSKRLSGPARTLMRAIKGDAAAVRKALSAA
jgi:putative transcriptional regulator